MKNIISVATILTAVSVGFLAGCTQEPSYYETCVNKDAAITDATQVLYRGIEDKNPSVRANAIEALASTMREKAGDVFVRELSDPSAPVVFAAAMAIGDVKYAPALDGLKKKFDEAKLDGSVKAAVIYAMYRIGYDEQCKYLVDLLFSTSKSARANAAMIMGLMGEPTAVGPLKSLLADEKDIAVKLNIIEALARLGDVPSAELLESFAKGRFVEDKLIAIPIVSRTRSVKAAGLLKELTSDKNPPTVRVMAAGMLGKIGAASDSDYKYCIKALNSPANVLAKFASSGQKITAEDISTLQQLSAMSLGWMHRKRAADSLYPLLRSNNGGVRIAAAMSLLAIFNDNAAPAVVQTPSPAPTPTTSPSSATTKPVVSDASDEKIGEIILEG